MRKIHIYAAAALLAAPAAGAADLPTKAKSEQYMKVCPAYGEGYFYIPGTDTCVKLTGFARFDTYINGIASFTPNIISSATPSFNGPGSGNLGYPFRDADDPDYQTRARGLLGLDVRTNTDYGTLRSYMRLGLNWDTIGTATGSPAAVPYFERAFIQFAGFTFGYTQSFFDPGYIYFMTTPLAGSFTWTTLAAYTVQLADGLSASLSIEDAANRTVGVQMTGSTAQPLLGISSTATGLGYANAQSGQQLPDVVANVRVDQPWGSLQLAGALHQVGVVLPAYAGVLASGETSTTWGWAVGAGIELKLPTVAAGDSIFFQADYAHGGVNYVGLSATPQVRAAGIGAIGVTQLAGALAGSGGFYPIADAVATSAFGDYALTTAWAIQGQLRHYWTPSLRSSLGAGYASYDVPDNIVGAFDFTTYQVIANTVWSPVKNIDIGVEVAYTKVDGSVPLGNYTSITSTGAQQASLVGGAADLWSGGVRVQRNF